MSETQIIDAIIFALLLFPATKLIFVVLGKPINAFVWDQKNQWKKKVEVPRIFLTILLVTSIFVMRHECRNTFEITTPKPGWTHWIEIIAILSIIAILTIGTILNLVYTNRFNKILIQEKVQSKVYFNLNTPNKTHERAFNNICRYFTDKHQLFEYNLSELEDLLKPNNKGMVFNIMSNHNKKFYFFLFFKICKDTCFKKNNTEIVAKERFLIDYKPIRNIKDNQSNALKKLTNKELRELKEDLKSYQINWEPKF